MFVLPIAPPNLRQVMCRTHNVPVLCSLMRRDRLIMAWYQTTTLGLGHLASDQYPFRQLVRSWCPAPGAWRLNELTALLLQCDGCKRSEPVGHIKAEQPLSVLLPSLARAMNARTQLNQGFKGEARRKDEKITRKPSTSRCIQISYTEFPYADALFGRRRFPGATRQSIDAL